VHDFHTTSSHPCSQINGTLGFNYQFDALNANEKESELSQAFQTIFGSASNGGMLDFLQSQVTLLRPFVSEPVLSFLRTFMELASRPF